MRKQRARSSARNKMYTLSLIFLILSLVFGVFLYRIVKESLRTTTVMITSKDVKAGHMFSEGDISSISVGKQGIQSNIATNKSNVVGKYATRDMMANEYIFSTSLTDDYIKRLSEKAKYGAIAIPIDNLQAVTGDIKENDFVGAYISVNIEQNGDERYEKMQGTDILPNAKTALIYSKELTAIRVLGLYDGNSNIAGSGSKTVNEDGETEYKTPSMIVFDAMPAQRTLLIQAIDNGKVRLIIHPEYIQREYRKAWGLEGKDSLETPEDQLQKEESNNSLQEQENIKNAHEQLSNDPVVSNYMQGAESSSKQAEASNQESLTPSQGVDTTQKPN